jgi:hypothetical protein
MDLLPYCSAIADMMPGPRLAFLRLHALDPRQWWCEATVKCINMCMYCVRYIHARRPGLAVHFVELYASYMTASRLIRLRPVSFTTVFVSGLCSGGNKGRRCEH